MLYFIIRKLILAETSISNTIDYKVGFETATSLLQGDSCTT